MQLGPKGRDLLLLLFFYYPRGGDPRIPRYPFPLFLLLSHVLSVFFPDAPFARIIFIEVADKKQRVHPP